MDDHRLDVLAATVIAIAAAFVNLAVFSSPHGIPCLTPDSATYTHWTVSRTPGYPAMLNAVLATTGSIWWIVPVQLNIYLAATVVMGWVMGTGFQNRFVTLFVVLGSWCIAPLIMTTWQVMTESLYASIICLHIAAILCLIRNRSTLASVMAGVTAGLLVAVRPSGYSFVAALTILVVVFRREVRTIVFPMAGTALCVFAITLAAQYVKHRVYTTQSFAGFSLAGHVAPLITEDLHTAYPDLTKRIARRIAPVMGDPERSPLAPNHASASANTFNFLLYRHVVPETIAYARQASPSFDYTNLWIVGNGIAMDIALSAIWENPAWYVFHSTSHYFSLWDQFLASYITFDHALAQCRHQSIALIRESPSSYPNFELSWYEKDRPQPISRSEPLTAWLDAVWELLKPLWIACVKLLLPLTVVGALWMMLHCPPPSPIMAVTYLGTALQSNLLFLAFTQPAIYRYVVPLMPFVVVIIVGWVTLGMNRISQTCALAHQKDDLAPKIAD